MDQPTLSDAWRALGRVVRCPYRMGIAGLVAVCLIGVFVTIPALFYWNSGVSPDASLLGWLTAGCVTGAVILWFVYNEAYRRRD